MNSVITQLKHGLIVSCQAEGDDPFNKPELLAKFAEAAQQGGARGIRAQGIENIKAIREVTDLPLIGIVEGHFENGWVCVTPDFKDIEALMLTGADIVAMDCTPRRRPNGMDGIEFFDEAREKYSIPLMADVSTFDEGIRAAELGADIIGTTLAGYTEYTEKYMADHPDYDLIEQIARAVNIPVISEGRVWTTDHAKESLRRGAYSVVVGSAIARPRVMTKKFVDALSSKIN